jgi:hypothetical protein
MCRIAADHPVVPACIRREPSGRRTSFVSKPDPITTFQADGEHQVHHRKVGGSNPSRHALPLDDLEIDALIVAALEQRLAVSFAVAARLLPDRATGAGAVLAEVTRQAGDQGCCGVEVRGFEPLASSVRESAGWWCRPAVLAESG